MVEKYNLDYLIETFTEHSKKYKPFVEKTVDDKEIIHDFDLSNALLNICKEIKILKNKINGRK